MGRHRKQNPDERGQAWQAQLFDAARNELRRGGALVAACVMVDESLTARLCDEVRHRIDNMQENGHDRRTSDLIVGVVLALPKRVRGSLEPKLVGLGLVSPEDLAVSAKPRSPRHVATFQNRIVAAHRLGLWSKKPALTAARDLRNRFADNAEVPSLLEALDAIVGAAASDFDLLGVPLPDLDPYAKRARSSAPTYSTLGELRFTLEGHSVLAVEAAKSHESTARSAAFLLASALLDRALGKLESVDPELEHLDRKGRILRVASRGWLGDSQLADEDTLRAVRDVRNKCAHENEPPSIRKCSEWVDILLRTARTLEDCFAHMCPAVPPVGAPPPAFAESSSVPGAPSASLLPIPPIPRVDPAAPTTAMRHPVGLPARLVHQRTVVDNSVKQRSTKVFDRHGLQLAGAGVVAAVAMVVLGLGWRVLGSWAASAPTRTQVAPTAQISTPRERVLPVVDAQASSYLTKEGKKPIYAFDGDESTAWCVPGGTKAWLRADLGEPVWVSAVETHGGWAYYSPRAMAAGAGDGDMWRLSNIATQIKVEWQGGSAVVSFSRVDDRGVTKRVEVGATTSFVRFTVLSVNVTSEGGRNVCLDGLRILGSAS